MFLAYNYIDYSSAAEESMRENKQEGHKQTPHQSTGTLTWPVLVLELFILENNSTPVLREKPLSLGDNSDSEFKDTQNAAAQ